MFNSIKGYQGYIQIWTRMWAKSSPVTERGKDVPRLSKVSQCVRAWTTASFLFFHLSFLFSLFVLFSFTRGGGGRVYSIGLSVWTWYSISFPISFWLCLSGRQHKLQHQHYDVSQPFIWCKSFSVRRNELLKKIIRELCKQSSYNLHISSHYTNKWLDVKTHG